MLLRLIGVKLSHLVSGFEQIGLYHTSEVEYDLYQAMDKVRNHYGIESVVKACIVRGPERDENGKVIKYNPWKKKKEKQVEGGEEKVDERQRSRIRTFINAELGTATKLDG